MVVARTASAGPGWSTCRSASSCRGSADVVGSGAAMFARYAFPPNELGHCGPPGADLLLAGGSGGAAGFLDGEVRRRAPHFDGAWPYLRLLASGAGVADPLDGEVVSAYWLGGALLDRVGSGDLISTALARFGRQPGVADRLAEAPGLAAAGAGHIFHVFVVYPWVGMLGGGSDVPRSILDSCRVRWGTVESVAGESAEIRFQPLIWDAGGLRLDRPGSRPAAGPGTGTSSCPACGRGTRCRCTGTGSVTG